MSKEPRTSPIDDLAKPLDESGMQVTFTGWKAELIAMEKKYDEVKADSEKLVEALNKYKQIVWRETMDGPIWAAQDALEEWHAKYGDSK